MPAPESAAAPRTRPWMLGALLVALIFAAYARVWHAGFIWDDDAHLTNNACIIGPLGFKEIWTSARAVYYPLVLTAFWIAHHAWGLNPMWYHALDVAAHAGCALLLWRVLLRLRVPGAWLGAAIWALHPVQVESAAWITELKNTQSGIFYLAAILFFLRWLETRGGEKPRAGFYAAAWLCAALAIVSKSSTVMLPVVLGLCWWWMEGAKCWRWRNALWLAPFLFISAAASVWTVWEQKYSWGAQGPTWEQTRPERLVIAGKDLWYYLFKLAWPHPLIFIYPRWHVGAGRLADWLPSLAAAGALLALWLLRKGPLRPVFFAAAYYAVSLFPVLDFFNVFFFRYSFVGDHFQFLASMGPLALAGAAMTVAFNNRALYATASAALLLLLGALTWRQTGAYQSLESLWRDTIAKNPDCWMAHYNLGLELVRQNRALEAVDEFKEDVRIDPGSVEGHGNLGTALAMEGNYKEAIEQYGVILRLQPGNAQARANLDKLLIYQARAGKHTGQ